MADDLGSECLGCYGGKDYATPRLDRMARQGLRFTHAFCTPLCTPTRVELMTGKYNHRNYVRFAHVDPKERTFGHMMQDAGYATCIVGKDQLGLKHQNGKHGFDTWCLGDLPHWQPRHVQVDGEKVETSPDDYGPDIYCDRLLQFVEAHRDRPFFAYFPMHLTHFPFESTPDSDGPRLRMEGKDWGGHRKTFPDMVAYCDKLVGRILDHVDRLGLAERTLVIFTTDNGTHQSFVSRRGNRKVKGGKSRLTDAGTRVPFIARWTDTTPAGRVCDDLIDFTDVYPTLADLAGADISGEKHLDGRSFLPQLRGREGNPREWVFLYHVPHGKVENPKRDGYWVRTLRWKLYHDGRLYDMKTDPEERSPIRPNADTPDSANARERLNKVFQQLDVLPRILPAEQG